MCGQTSCSGAPPDILDEADALGSRTTAPASCAHQPGPPSSAASRGSRFPHRAARGLGRATEARPVAPRPLGDCPRKEMSEACSPSSEITRMWLGDRPAPGVWVRNRMGALRKPRHRSGFPTQRSWRGGPLPPADPDVPVSAALAVGRDVRLRERLRRNLLRGKSALARLGNRAVRVRGTNMCR